MPPIPAFLRNANLNDAAALQSCARILRATLLAYKPDDRILNHLNKAKKLIQTALRLSITNLEQARTFLVRAIVEYDTIRRIRTARYRPNRRPA